MDPDVLAAVLDRRPAIGPNPVGITLPGRVISHTDDYTDDPPRDDDEADLRLLRQQAAQLIAGWARSEVVNHAAYCRALTHAQGQPRVLAALHAAADILYLVP